MENMEFSFYVFLCLSQREGMMTSTQTNTDHEKNLVFLKHFYLCKRPETSPQVKHHNEIGL